LTFQQVPEQAPLAPSSPPNACGTCIYLRGKSSAYPYDYQCAAYLKDISTSLATMTDYATMVRAGVRDRQGSGPVFLTASANVRFGLICIRGQCGDQNCGVAPETAASAPSLMTMRHRAWRLRPSLVYDLGVTGNCQRSQS
jgi:hypothetical protein